jgi:hypothetical protein
LILSDADFTGSIPRTEAAKQQPRQSRSTPRPLEDVLVELDALVGLERVKADVRQLINFLKVQKMRE